jgi:hypothetical protein
VVGGVFVGVIVSVLFGHGSPFQIKQDWGRAETPVACLLFVLAVNHVGVSATSFAWYKSSPPTIA